MICTVVLTEKVDGHIHVSVPGLPDCTVEATTRKEALDKVRETLAATISRSEIIQLDVSTEPKAGNGQYSTPWEWFGRFSSNPAWGTVFDEIEQQSDGKGL